MPGLPVAKLASFGAAGPAGDGGGGSNLAEPTRTRINFPETWLWENVTTGYIDYYVYCLLQCLHDICSIIISQVTLSARTA
jgi:hypothetical protein